MLLVIFCLIRPIYSLFAKADFPDAHLSRTPDVRRPWVGRHGGAVPSNSLRDGVFDSVHHDRHLPQKASLVSKWRRGAGEPTEVGLHRMGSTDD